MLTKEIQKMKITGEEIYGVYQPDICYVNRDGVERTLQIIIPETAQDSNKKYPAILHVQGSAWKKQDVYKEYSCKVNAVADLYGVSCVKIKEDFPTTPNQGEPDSPEGLEIGSKNVYEHPELSDQITCMNYVKKELPSPPVLMMHGAADDTVAPNQSIQLYKKLKEEDKDATFYLVEGADHGHPYFWSEPTLSLIE